MDNNAVGFLETGGPKSAFPSESWFTLQFFSTTAATVFFPNDLRYGFRKLKRTGGRKSALRTVTGAEIFVVVVIIVVVIMHARRRPGLDSYYTNNIGNAKSAC